MAEEDGAAEDNRPRGVLDAGRPRRLCPPGRVRLGGREGRAAAGRRTSDASWKRPRRGGRENWPSSKKRSRRGSRHTGTGSRARRRKALKAEALAASRPRESSKSTSRPVRPRAQWPTSSSASASGTRYIRGKLGLPPRENRRVGRRGRLRQGGPRPTVPSGQISSISTPSPGCSDHDRVRGEIPDCGVGSSDRSMPAAATVSPGNFSLREVPPHVRR